MINLNYYCPHCGAITFELIPECKIDKEHSVCPYCKGRTDLIKVLITADKKFELDNNGQGKQ